MTTQTANSVLMGGGGAPGFKFSAHGDTVSGRIIAISDPYQEREYDPSNPGNGALKTFKNGNPIMTFNMDIATTLRDPSIDGDDGTRRVYMDGSRIKQAVRQAVQAAGANGLTVGATISIAYIGDQVPGDHRSGKIYQVTYTPGQAADAVLMGQQDAPAPAPVQQAQPQAAAPVAAPAAAPAPPAPAGFSTTQLAAMKAAGMTDDQIAGLLGG